MATSSKPIWEQIADIGSALPDDAIAGLPVDGASQLDHYLYGAPKKMATTIIGIDPGMTSGGFAWISGLNGEACAQKFEGLTERDIREWLADIGGGYSFAYLERVGANKTTSTGERAKGAGSMFSFGQNYGLLRGLLIGLNIPFEDVWPQKWLHAMGLRGVKGETLTQKKNRHKAKAQQLWPALKITHKVCDALLLAEYGRRQLNGAPK